jgi:predicted alpha/beta hydrolase family esterase
MKTAMILHGMPSEKSYLDSNREAQSNSHWLPWIQQQLLTKGILAQTPELPNPFKPVYEDWKSIFERHEINENTLLVGHSCGAGFLVRWLSENDVRVGKVVLVAPWMDPHHELDGFFEFNIDPHAIERTKGVDVFISEDDDEEMHTAVNQIKEAWPAAVVHSLKDKGHFTLRDMGTREFPELREVLLG